MINRTEKDWAEDIQRVIRSRHYTWLARGLGGESVEDAATSLLTDIMHICRREGIPWQRVLEAGQRQFEREEREQSLRS